MFSFKYASWLTTCTVFTAFIAVVLQAYWASQDLSKLTTILSGLITLENANSTVRIDMPRIAIGYGSCSDLYVPAIKFLNYTSGGGGDGGAKGNFTADDIHNQNDLLLSFGHYFRKGAAAERFTSNQTLFRQLIASTKGWPNTDARWSLGGNAPVMGMRFAKEGAIVLLAAQMSHRLRKFIPESIQITGDPIDYDDIHLIMEYKTDDEWGPYTAPRANRYILHNDQSNPTISSLEYLEQTMPAFDARLFVVSGLQMLDSYPFQMGIREKRLHRVQEQITQLPLKTLIHFEMASFVEVKLIDLLLKHIIPYSDSIGMNEQELDNLQHFLGSGKVSYASESNPRVAQALNQMRQLFKTINSAYFKSTDAARRMLTRIHVHTLAYQAILVVKDSAWKNTKNAAAKAALTAHRHVCGSDIVNPESAILILDDSFSTDTDADTDSNAPKRILLSGSDPVPCWMESISVAGRVLDIEICVAPVLVCKVARQTAGAGDNISAAGLVMQL